MSAEASSSRFNLEGIDDVQDYPWANPGEVPSLSWDRYNHLCKIVQMGNKAYRDNRWDEAINSYTSASNIKQDDLIILSNRCASYLRYSQFLKSRSALDSEYRPLNGLDPTTYAGLALKDAEKVMHLQNNSVTSYILKANSLILLEKYELAQEVIRSGLQMNPLSIPLLNLEKAITATFGRRSHGRPHRSDDFDCTLCLKLLYEPITTPCGHSYCRSCLFQSMDRYNRCPLCRTVLYISPRTCAISVTLNNIIQKTFPEEYAERKAENDGLINLGADLLPLFVMEVILPCEKLALNIFEPRYRLMVRRIMEGNRRMGMAVHDPTTGSVADYACEVEIIECEPLPDGRFFLEIQSRRRCRIVRHWDQDGYRVAEVEWMHDISPAEGTRERHELLETANKAATFAQQWLRNAQEVAGDRRRAELFKAEGLMPSPQDPERLSFWLNTLTSRRPSEKLDLLQMTDTHERLEFGLTGWKAQSYTCKE
ncbi:unnamed protein product [Withania somnifera]